MTAMTEVVTSTPGDGLTLSPQPTGPIRNDWSRDEISELFSLPFADLMFKAQSVHRAFHDANKVQLSRLLSIKTGGCAEDCAYCPQSQTYAEATGVAAEKLMAADDVVADAKRAQAEGATRYCMGAAWSRPKSRDMDRIEEIVRGVKSLGLETCMTLGMLNSDQAMRLKGAGLDYYNHNIDTSPEFYGDIITTRQFDDRLDTLSHVRNAGIHVCCGGIVGMGEGRADRVGMLEVLATMERHPESVPVNMLVKVEGTPLHEELSGREALDPLEFIRTIAVARILMPASYVRLSAGRENMSDEMQALAFLAGANSVFTGDRLLTTPNPGGGQDADLFSRLGVTPE